MAYFPLVTKNAAKGLLQGDPTNGAMRFSIDGGQTWKEISVSSFVGITALSYADGILTITYSDTTSEDINLGVDNFLSNVSFDSGTSVMTFTMVDSSHIDVDMSLLVASKANKVTATEDTILVSDFFGDLKATSKLFGGTTFNSTPNVSTIPNESSVSTYVANALLPYVTEEEMVAILGSFATDDEVASGYVAKEAGKGLSSNDFTSGDKSKLDGIEAGAEVNVNADWNATSGDAQILNKPTIPDAQIQSDWTQATNTAKDFIKNKPTIPTAPVNADWNSTSGLSQILNKPTIPTNSSFTLTGLSEKSYASLTDKPTIPAAQVQSDWNATSGIGQILNKPAIPSKTSDLTNDSGFITASAVASGYVAKATGYSLVADTQITKLSNLPTISSIGTGLSLASGVLSLGTHTHAYTDVTGLTASRVVVSNSSGILTSSSVTVTTLSYLDATSSIQTQLNAKQATISGAATTITTSNLTASRALVSDSSGKVAVSTVTGAELGYLSGATSSIQTQINAKVDKATGYSLVADTLITKLTNLPVITSISTGLTLTNGVLTADGGASVPAGSIISFSVSIPSGFIELEADKTASRSTYSTLFSALGTKYGKGDGSSTFGLPDANLTLDKATISNVLPVAKYSAPSTLLSDGRILVVGGYGSSGVIASCHIGTISGSEISWVETNALPVALFASAVATLSDGRVIVVGGGNASLNSVNTIYFGTVSGNTITWTLSASTYPSVIRQQGSLLLDDGRLACFGGYVTSSNTTAVYFGTISGNTVSWASGTALTGAWRDMRGVRVSSDSFMLAGGLTTAVTSVAVIGTLSGNTITWTTSTSLPAARLAGACAIMKDGSVVYAGGCTTTTATSGTDTIYRGRVFKDEKKVIWELVGYLPDVIGYADCVISSENNLIIAGLANASGASNTTIILPISRQGIKT